MRRKDKNNKFESSVQPDFQESYFLLQSHPYTFYAVVKAFLNHNHDMIHVGGKKKYVTIRYDHIESEFTLLVAPYDEHCTLEGCMDRGIGTIRMMKAAFTFLKRRYPHAKKEIVFSDNSTIECKNLKRMQLSHYFLAVHGMTWYEAKFGAFPTKECIQTYQTEQRMLMTLLDTKPTFESFMTFTPSKVQDFLQPFYAKSKNLRDFVKRCTNQYDCVMLLPWLPTIVVKCMPNLVLYSWNINLNIDANQTTLHVKTLSKRPEEVLYG